MLKKRNKRVLLISISIIILLGGMLTLIYIPEKDIINLNDIPKQFKINTDKNYIYYQDGNDCSAFAASYVMRHLGKDINASDLYSDINRMFGLVSANSVVELFEKYDYNAKAYHGDINTLKSRLLDGIPVIAFVSIPNDTHYIVIVGYDEDYIYIVDSILENCNEDGGWYNRKLSIDEFKDIWKTNMYPVDDVYIVIR